jgi:hypothetical protein
VFAANRPQGPIEQPAGLGNAVNWLWQLFDPASISRSSPSFAEMQQPAFWVALGKIMWINILLSGDNALVIAMACRGLPARQRFWGMILGAGVAVFLRIIFTGIVVTLMGCRTSSWSGWRCW